MVFPLPKRFVPHLGPLVLLQMGVEMGWRRKCHSAGKRHRTLSPGSTLSLPPSLPGGACHDASVRRHCPCAKHCAFHLIATCDVSLLLPQKRTCRLLGGASDRSDGSDLAAMGWL